ncbi:hypothetical protein ANN_11021 [Periplaneta americana]|uniref:HTH psq-type domain-containing protein n=1 Tax=Periplaneta americana TaxID=6978 RepID=A0ABQ8T5L5_PERAM|nr:hypothetical protein ANN_11021 [Periplaneta americana]
MEAVYYFRTTCTFSESLVRAIAVTSWKDGMGRMSPTCVLAPIQSVRYSASSYDFSPTFIDIYDVVQRAATRGDPRVETSTETILSDTGMGIRCGLVDKASARRAENPGSNPGAGENFLCSITLSSYDDAEYLHGNITCTSIYYRNIQYFDSIMRDGKERKIRLLDPLSKLILQLRSNIHFLLFLDDRAGAQLRNVNFVHLRHNARFQQQNMYACGTVRHGRIGLPHDERRDRDMKRGESDSRYLASECYGGDNAGEMSPGSNTESYPAFARIGLRENPGKNLNQITCPDRDLNPGHLVSRPDALTVTPQMVKCKRKTSNSWTENGMQKAIKAFREGRSQRHAAEMLGVPHSCLQRRLQRGQDNHLKSKSRQTTFTPEQENEFVSRILKLYACGFGLHCNTVRWCRKENSVCLWKV